MVHCYEAGYHSGEYTEQQRADLDRVFASNRRPDEGGWGPEERVSTTGDHSFNQEVAAHTDGSDEVCWQGPLDKRLGIYARRSWEGSWEPSRLASRERPSPRLSLSLYGSQRGGSELTVVGPPDAVLTTKTCSGERRRGRATPVEAPVIGTGRLRVQSESEVSSAGRERASHPVERRLHLGATSASIRPRVDGMVSRI
jgi:hypothetical protein